MAEALYRVWTRTGGKPHVTTARSRYTYCGREHMGIRSPSSGADAPRFSKHMEESTCKVCVQEAHRAQRQVG